MTTALATARANGPVAFFRSTRIAPTKAIETRLIEDTGRYEVRLVCADGYTVRLGGARSASEARWEHERVVAWQTNDERRCWMRYA